MPKGGKKKKRVTIDRATAMCRIDEMMALVEMNVRIGLDIEAALETANEIVMSNIGNEPIYGAGCYKTVKDSLALNLAITLARLFDPGAVRYHTNKRDIASIPLLVRPMKQKRCRAAIVARAREYLLEFPELSHSQEVACERAIDCAIETYVGLRRTHEGRQAAATLKQYRDRKLAHSLMDSAIKSLPRYRQLFLLMDVARDFTDNAKFAIFGSNPRLKGIEKERWRESRAFWEPALKAAVAGS